MFAHISIDARICHGQACVKGTRIPVSQIIDMLAHGDTIEVLLEDYPSLQRLIARMTRIAIDGEQSCQNQTPQQSGPGEDDSAEQIVSTMTGRVDL